MKAPRRPAWLVFSAVFTVGIGAGVYVDVHPGWFFNFSGSAPQGVWRAVEPESGAAHSLGSWVVVCPPLTAAQHRQLFVEDPPIDETCPSQVSLKRIAAIPDDRVVVTYPTVKTPLGTVSAVAVDLHGEPLPRPPDGIHIVPANTYWVLNLHPRSVDSRYFGPVTAADIEYVVRPILTLP